MKNYISKSILALAAVLTLASCAKEKYETDQFGGAPTLTAFAPNPVYRGGELTFIGSYLEQVAEVQVPGVDPITEITVETSGAKSRIKVTLPNSTEEVGVLTLVTKSGAKLVSKTELTYTEPVVFGDFSPKSAMPGDVITVTGDYMNLIQEVIFAGSAYAVGEAISDQTRKELKVVVPDNAISGRFILGDTDEVADPDNVANKVYSTGELTIGDPKITALGEVSPKAGQKITVSGQYLAMIASASVSGVAVEYTVEAGSKHGEKLVFTVPDTSADGEIVLTSYAGKEFVAGKVKTVVPTGLAIAAERYKAGLVATISGKDLDLVTGVAIGGAACEYTYDEAKKNIAVTISDKAVDGAVELSLANGKTVAIEGDVELVKPVITSVAPLELYAGDEPVVVVGTDLDLVVSASIGGNNEEIELKEDGLYISTTVASVGGKVALTLANKVVVEAADEVKMNYHALVIVNERTDSQHIGEEVVLKGSNMDLIENIFIGDAKVTKYLCRTAEETRFLMPWNKVGSYTMSFHLFNGDIENQAAPIEVLLERTFTVAWEGNLQISWADDGKIAIPIETFDGVKAGAKMRFFYTQKDQQWAQAQLNNGAWAQIPFPEIPSGTLVPTDIYGWFADGILDRITEVTLTAEVLDNIRTNAGEFNGAQCGLIIQGSDLTFTKIDIVGEISQEKTLWSGSFVCDGWNGNQDLAWGAFDWSTITAGQVLKFYMTSNVAEGDWWCISLRHGNNWGNLPSPIPGQYDSPGEVLEVELTQDIITDLVDNNGLVITGTGFTLSEITVL